MLSHRFFGQAAGQLGTDTEIRHRQTVNSTQRRNRTVFTGTEDGRMRTQDLFGQGRTRARHADDEDGHA